MAGVKGLGATAPFLLVLVVLWLLFHPKTAMVVVCDSIVPEAVSDPTDPYLRAVAHCTLGDVNGVPVEVKFID